MHNRVMDAQAFPDGDLEGAVLHWALAARPGAAWQPAPTGWASDPAASAEAGAPRHPAVGVCQTLPETCGMSPRLLCCTGLYLVDFARRVSAPWSSMAGCVCAHAPRLTLVDHSQRWDRRRRRDADATGARGSPRM